MKSNKVLFDLGWSTNYKKLLAYGKTNIDESKASSIVTGTRDPHVITLRLLNDKIPQWIADIFPLRPNVLQIFAIPPHSLGMTHKDGLARKAAINIPLVGYDTGYMNWFEESEQLREHVINCDYTQIRLIEQERTNIGYRIDVAPDVISTVTSPSIINTDVWHRVDNRQNDKFRWVVSIRFENNPSFDELVSTFAS